MGAQLPAALLAPCGRVVLAESTPGRWPEKLAEAVKGSGGRASTAMVNSDRIDDSTHPVIPDLPITDGTAADQARAAALVPPLRANDLGWRDVGSLCLTALRQIADQQA